MRRSGPSGKVSSEHISVNYVGKGNDMKLFRFGAPGVEKPAVEVQAGLNLDVTEFGEDYDESFFGSNGIKRLRTWLKIHAQGCPPVSSSERVGACIKRPPKIVCVGLNYAKHAVESRMEVPKEPVLFMKASSALSGANDDVIIPPGSTKTDWEVELALIIGKPASYVSREEALDHIAGYCLHNDYSERSFQLERGGQWVKGKSCDSFAPLGPYLVPADEVADPHNLRLWLKLNGEMLQDSNTGDLIFRIPEIVSYISKFMRLLPGDVVSTGTPFGVGLGLKPPRYLKQGDTVEYGIDGLGVAKQRAVNHRLWGNPDLCSLRSTTTS